jgi:flagellin
VDVRTELQATVSIERVSLAIEQVSAQRSELGAYQNRLEHTINNLDNVVENTTSSESKLRDTDMADEMVRYSSYSVLMQAGQSMLAQANSSKNSVLSLFS